MAHQDDQPTRTDEDYRLATTKMLDIWAARHASTVENYNTVGRWMLATLVAINGAAVLGLLNGKNVSDSAIHYAAPWFGVGVVMALASGFGTWANLMAVVEFYDDLVDPWVILDRGRWPKPDEKRDRRIKGWAALSVWTGFFSIAAFVGGSIAAWLTISAPIARPVPPQPAVRSQQKTAAPLPRPRPSAVAPAKLH